MWIMLHSSVYRITLNQHSYSLFNWENASKCWCKWIVVQGSCKIDHMSNLMWSMLDSHSNVMFILSSIYEILCFQDWMMLPTEKKKKNVEKFTATRTNKKPLKGTRVRSSISRAVMVLLGVGGRLQHGFLHHAHVEASLIPAEKETNLDNEVQ